MYQRWTDLIIFGFPTEASAKAELHAASAVATRQSEQARLLSPAAAVWGWVKPEYAAKGRKPRPVDSKIRSKTLGTLKYMIGFYFSIPNDLTTENGFAARSDGWPRLSSAWPADSAPC